MSPGLIAPGELQRFADRVLGSAGACSEDAQVVADALVWADLRGRHSQGVERLPMLVRRLERGLIRSPAAMHIDPVAPAAERLDAGDGFGHVAGRLAMSRAIELSRVHGIGCVAVRRSNLYGAASYFCEQATTAGCLGFTCTNAVAKVAAFGGTRPVLGTNPLAFGCPMRSGAPLLVDLSTSAVSGSAAREALETGAALPAGTALDKNGHPTTDPAAAEGGCLLPAADAKGFGLALMVEILSGVLSGAAVGPEVGSMYETWDRPPDTGHFFLAVDIAGFQPLPRFLDRVDALADAVKQSGLREGFSEVRLPGEIRARLFETSSLEGVALPRRTLQALKDLSERFGLPLAPGQSLDGSRQ